MLFYPYSRYPDLTGKLVLNPKSAVRLRVSYRLNRHFYMCRRPDPPQFNGQRRWYKLRVGYLIRGWVEIME